MDVSTRHPYAGRGGAYACEDGCDVNDGRGGAPYEGGGAA